MNKCPRCGYDPVAEAEIKRYMKGLRELDPNIERERAEQIIALVALERGVKVEDIKSSKRSRQIWSARQEAIQRVRSEFRDWYLKEIGEVFGKDHSSIYYALNGKRGKLKE